MGLARPAVGGGNAPAAQLRQGKKLWTKINLIFSYILKYYSNKKKFFLIF
jgi:hypothetical protein